MDKFSALSDPNRRKIIELLAQRGPLSASEIGEQFSVSPPAISQHLKVLREAGFVQTEKRAQQRIYHLDLEALKAVGDWAAQITYLWNRRFDALERVLEAEKMKALQDERIAKMTQTNQKELTLNRVYDAPRDLVFKAWTDPRMLAQWFAPEMFSVPTCEVDPRPGGAIYLIMRGPDGTEFPLTGVYNEVKPYERIVFSSGAVMDAAGNPQLETLTTVNFTEEGGKTKMTVQINVTKAGADANFALAGMEEGWKQSLEKFAVVVAQ